MRNLTIQTSRCDLLTKNVLYLVHQFLHGVKEPYKEVFNLRVFGELSFEKIGRIFGKSTGWARVTYYRAKQQMIDYMEVIDNEDTPL